MKILLGTNFLQHLHLYYF